MKKNVIHHSLLQEVTTRDVDDLIFEEELITKNYQFYYSIDPTDIKKYCFPFGLTKSKTNPDHKELEIIADEQTSILIL